MWLLADGEVVVRDLVEAVDQAETTQIAAEAVAKGHVRLAREALEREAAVGERKLIL